MQYFEGTLSIILSTFLLILIITVSQSIRSKAALLINIEKDLEIELNVLRICRQNPQDVNGMLKEIIEFLDSNGIRWCTVELLNKKNGKMFVENNSSNIARRQVQYIRVVKISSEDTMYITLGIEE